jgi:hypothetical protein
MLPLTGYGSEMRRLRQGPVDRVQRRPLEQENETAVAAEPSLHEGHVQGRRATDARLLVLPKGEQGHKSSLSGSLNPDFPIRALLRILRGEGL